MMQERRPILIQAPAHDKVSETVHATFRMVARGRSVSPTMGRQYGGMLFAFSDEPFTVHFGSGRGKQGAMHHLTAVAIPEDTLYNIEHRGTLYTVTVALDVAKDSGVHSPVGFTMHNIKSHLPHHHDGHVRPNKLVIPSLMYGEVMARGGERVDQHSRKHVVVGPENQEFSVANNTSPQDLHVHRTLVESYTPFGAMRLYYVVEGQIEHIEVRSGQTVITPTGVAHRAFLLDDKPTFVTMSNHGPIKDDKFLVPAEEQLDAMIQTKEAKLARRQ